ncbi:transcriptional regulator [Bifidobacterium vansinderenii]|uniref:Transcriptional regulator n=1 Tax=Bifidobacterium vansinderenii TaxID=1984871 RepID=A0A229VWR1_9BIFI|nr:transcriptional regulator [Bifidobacterium vansinderenii]
MTNDVVSATDNTTDETTNGACCGCHDHTDRSGNGADSNAHGDADHNTHGYIQDQKKIVARLSRIEGQVRGIKQMAQNGDYCIDILTQISAANSALRSVALLLLDDHLSHCVKQASAQGDQVADDKLKEASAAIARLVKS